MPHDHNHHNHNHSPALTSVNNAFIIGIALNFLFVIIEVCAGFYIHSLSLLSDAGHNLADVAALALSLLAFKLMKVRSNKQFTYGYRKTSILVALFNSMVLLISIAIIVYEAVQRFLHPEPLPGTTIALVAGIGIIVNATTALMFFRGKDSDMNVKSAYLHLMSDAVVSLGLVIGGVIIYYTNWFWIDSALSIIVAIVIFFSTWSLLKNSLRLSMDGVPDDIQLEDLKSEAMKIIGVRDIHHIHVWAISTTENALTAHLLLDDKISILREQEIKEELKHNLLHKNVHHATIETERNSKDCQETACEPTPDFNK